MKDVEILEYFYLLAVNQEISGMYRAISGSVALIRLFNLAVMQLSQELGEVLRIKGPWEHWGH